MKRRPPQPVLQLYRSPRFVVERQQRRVEILVPTGWTPLPVLVERSDDATYTIVTATIRIVPRQRLARWPFWLRWPFNRSVERNAALELTVGSAACERNI